MIKEHKNLLELIIYARTEHKNINGFSWAFPDHNE